VSDHEEPRAVAYGGRGWYRLHAPAEAPRPAPCLVALHGYGQAPEEMWEYARRVAPPDAIVVVPEGPLSWYRKPGGTGGAAAGGVGYGWIADPRRDDADARNTRFLEAVWADVHRAHPLDPARTAVLGYSQGVGVAVHWMLEHQDRAKHLVALAGGVRTALRPRLGSLRGLSALWVTGERDAAYPAAYTAELLPVLRSAGLVLEHVSLPTGHGVPEPALAHVRSFLAARLGG
jgi:predicted esterase